MLSDVLGLSPGAEAVYRRLLLHPGSTTDSLVERCGGDQTKTRDLLAELVDLRLVEAGGTGWRPCMPAVALAATVEQAQADVVRQQQAADRLRCTVDELTALHVSGAALAKGLDVERLEGRDTISARLRALTSTCDRELCFANPEPKDHPEYVRESLEDDDRLRGLALPQRGLFPLTLTATTHLWPYAVAAQEPPLREYRLTADLDLCLVLIDDRVAVVPIEPRTPHAAAYILQSPALIHGLRTAFDSLWRSALPVACHGVDQLSVRERSLLHLWAQGAKDERVARQLGVGLRTVRRLSAELLDKLGVETRFQAALVASSRNWL